MKSKQKSRKSHLHAERRQSKPAAPVVGKGASPAGLTARRWIFRLAVIVLVPLLLLGGLELGLRLCGFGYSSSFFQIIDQDGQEIVVENPRFGWLFFPPTIARTPHPLRFAAQKPPGTCRIFVFGESAALGDPEPAYGFSRFLEVMLELKRPDKKFEVINVSMTAINSHAIRLIAKECARFDGDLWIIYAGNNEVVGPFGPGTIFGSQYGSLGLLRAILALKATRIGQLLELASQRLRAKTETPINWQGMEMFIGQQVRRDDPRLKTAYKYFEQNLNDIVRLGDKSGARVVVSTVASNLKDCAPFGSLHKTNFPAPSQAEWESLCKTGSELEAAGNHAQAEQAFRQAARIDPDYAEAQFRLGQCLLETGQDKAALDAFDLARDLDTLRFRADSIQNKIIMQAGSNNRADGVYLVDTAAAIANASADGVPGDEYFYEHVHLNFAGSYLLAKTLAQEIIRILPLPGIDSVTDKWPAMAECERRLALTSWSRYTVLESMRQRFENPPFTNQLNHIQRQERIQTELSALKPAIAPAELAGLVTVYREAIEKRPDDWEIHNQYAKLLEAIDDLEAAEGQLRAVIKLVPQSAVAHYQLGRLLNRSKNHSAAIESLNVALAIWPNFAEALNSLGIALAHQGEFETACMKYKMALSLKPDFAEAHVNWAMTLAAQGQTAQAIERYNTALQTDPNNYRAHLNLAKLMSSQPSPWEAVKHYTIAFRLQPQDAAIHFQQGNAALTNANYAEALARFAETVRLDPEHPGARHQFGLELARQRRLQEAETQFLEAVRLKPDSAMAHFDLGVALAQQAKLSQAIIQFKETLRLDPSNQVAQTYLRNAIALENKARQQTAP